MFMRVRSKLKIQLSHGSGGEDTAALIREYFMPRIGSRPLNAMEDAAVLPGSGQIALTTDSFVVKPLLFPGGDIGRLVVCGSVNDLLAVGAEPRYLSMGFVLETGLDTDVLITVLNSIKETAAEASVSIVTADTKVIEGGGGLIINAAGVGFVDRRLCISYVSDGDSIIISGFLGEHHACILSKRMGIENTIVSDAAPLNDICSKLKRFRVHAMRDITRGGLSTILHEIASACGCRMVINEASLPVSAPVRGLCDILGLDPLLMGNEGNMAVFLPSDEAEEAVKIIRSSQYGQNAAIIGHTENRNGKKGDVLVKTRIGGTRLAPPLRGEGLPRIC